MQKLIKENNESSIFVKKFKDFISHLWSNETEKSIIKLILKYKKAIIKDPTKGKEYLLSLYTDNQILIEDNCSNQFKDEFNKLINEYKTEPQLNELQDETEFFNKKTKKNYSDASYMGESNKTNLMNKSKTKISILEKVNEFFYLSESDNALKDWENHKKEIIRESNTKDWNSFIKSPNFNLNEELNTAVGLIKLHNLANRAEKYLESFEIVVENYLYRPTNDYSYKVQINSNPYADKEGCIYFDNENTAKEYADNSKGKYEYIGKETIKESIQKNNLSLLVEKLSTFNWYHNYTSQIIKESKDWNKEEKVIKELVKKCGKDGKKLYEYLAPWNKNLLKEALETEYVTIEIVPVRGKRIPEELVQKVIKELNLDYSLTKKNLIITPQSITIKKLPLSDLVNITHDVKSYSKGNLQANMSGFYSDKKFFDTNKEEYTKAPTSRQVVSESISYKDLKPGMKIKHTFAGSFIEGGPNSLYNGDYTPPGVSYGTITWTNGGDIAIKWDNGRETLENALFDSEFFDNTEIVSELNSSKEDVIEEGFVTDPETGEEYFEPDHNSREEHLDSLATMVDWSHKHSSPVKHNDYLFEEEELSLGFENEELGEDNDNKKYLEDTTKEAHESWKEKCEEDPDNILITEKSSGKKLMKKVINTTEKYLKRLYNSVLNEAINQPDYKFYVVSLNQNKIISGFEYQEDARDYINEFPESFGKLKIYTKQFLKSKGLDPDSDSSWGTDILSESNILTEDMTTGDMAVPDIPALTSTLKTKQTEQTKLTENKNKMKNYNNTIESKKLKLKETLEHLHNSVLKEEFAASKAPNEANKLDNNYKKSDKENSDSKLDPYKNVANKVKGSKTIIKKSYDCLTENYSIKKHNLTDKNNTLSVLIENKDKKQSAIKFDKKDFAKFIFENYYIDSRYIKENKFDYYTFINSRTSLSKASIIKEYFNSKLKKKK